KGRERVAHVAEFLKRSGVEPTHFVSSPRVRAMETAQIVADTFETRDVKVLLSLDFDGSWKGLVRDLHRLVHRAPNAVVLAAGHEPRCGSDLGAALGLGRAPIPFRRAAMACLRWDGLP